MQHKNITKLFADIPSVFAGLAAEQPDNPAILAPGRLPLSFAGLYAQLNYVRDRLVEWGIGRGDCVAVLLPKGPEMAVALAVLPVSATVLALDPKLLAGDYERLFHRASTKAVILMKGAHHNARIAADRTGLCQIELVVDPDNQAGTFDLITDAIANKPPDGRVLSLETAYILSTSGTTAERKLIPYRHDHIIRYAQTMKDWLGLTSTDISLHLVPMYFGSGIKGSVTGPLLGNVPPPVEIGSAGIAC